MRKIWNRIKSFLSGLREYFSDYDDGYLTRSDKEYLLFGALAICLLSIVCTSWVMHFSYRKTGEEYEKGLTDFLNALATYTANLTDDEYEAVAEELRHQLAFTEFDADNDIEMYMKYIANTSDNCPLDRENYPYRYYLVMSNNGEMQAIDCWAKEAESEADVVSFGAMWDEVSETSVRLLYYHNKQETEITVSSERGTVSVHRMKQTFCDECIRKLLSVFDETIMEEIVVFDAQSDKILPVREGYLELDGYTLEIRHNEHGGYSVNYFPVS